MNAAGHLIRGGVGRGRLTFPKVSAEIFFLKTPFTYFPEDLAIFQASIYQIRIQKVYLYLCTVIMCKLFNCINSLDI